MTQKKAAPVVTPRIEIPSPTIHTLASELYAALITDKRSDGEEFTKLKDGSPQWMTDVIHSAHGDSMPDDTIYQFCREVASKLDDCEEGDDLTDAINEIEPDPYTGHLTAWLAKRCDHVYYLTEVLTEMGGNIKDGFQLLSMAQHRHIQEVGHALLAALEEHLQTLSD